MRRNPNDLPHLIAIAALFVVASLFWFAQIDFVARPASKPIDAPFTEFSAARAEIALEHLLGPERPHPVSTAENAAVRLRIVQAFTALGMPVTVKHGFGCHAWRSAGMVACASVNDILSWIKPGAGKAIVLLAHYDSVPAGPGAADDGSGVATVLETARALKAQGLKSQHPILALITDGEEAGLLGAAAFLHDPALKARVGAVVNVEARGNHGSSLLFQTSPGAAPLIDLYANSVKNYATSSLYAEIYRLLPNDTDLTLFIGDGFPSFNFAFSENVAHYHTTRDTRANLDPQSLQQQGDNMLGVASALEQTDFARLHGGEAIYADLLGRALPRMPASWALPFAGLCFVLILLASVLAYGPTIGTWRWIAAFAITPVLIAVAAATGWLLHTIAVEVSGMPDPSYAHPEFLRVSLALGVAAVCMLVSRLAPLRACVAAVWLWMTSLGIVVAIFVPGFTPYFLFPSIVASLLLLATARAPESWNGGLGLLTVFLSALPALLFWVGIGASGETVMGLKLHPLFTVPIAMGMTTLIPLVAHWSLSRGAWIASTAIAFLAAIGVAVFAGMQPSYSAAAPQRLSISYVEDRTQPHALWALDAAAPVPKPMRKAADFSSLPRKASAESWGLSYVAPAGSFRYAPPGIKILTDEKRAGLRRVTLVLQGSDRAEQMVLAVPDAASLEAIDVHNWHYDAAFQKAKSGGVTLICMSSDCASLPVTLTMRAGTAFDLDVGEQIFGLPDFAQPLVAARPDTAVPSQNGDGVTLLNRVHVPAD